MSIPFISKFDGSGKPSSVTVFVDGKPYPVLASARFFDEIFSALVNGNIAEVKRLLNLRQSIAEFSGGKFQLFDDGLYYNGAELHNVIVERVLAIYKFKGKDAVNPVIAFLENLLQNPSQSSIDELYLFMEHNDLPITEDGHFLAYKMISNDYKDLYTGTMDNSVGKVVKMARNGVDDNRNRTCSSGLHFCSLEYVEKGSYGTRRVTGGDRLVVLKINPRDVVSIPTDYNNSKGRACEYLILQEIEWTDRIKAMYVESDSVTEYDEDEEDTEYCYHCGEVESDCECDGEEEDTRCYGEIPGCNDPECRNHNDEAEETESKTGLSEEDVKSIRKLLKTGNLNLTQIGNMYGVHRTTIQRIRDGISHKN